MRNKLNILQTAYHRQVDACSAFCGSFDLIDDTGHDLGSRPTVPDYANWVKATLEGMRSADKGVLRFRVPRPTAALSPQDAAHPKFEIVKNQMRARGFEPIERGTGGRLSVFDERAFAVAIIAPHSDPKQKMLQRFELLSSAISSALTSLGVDARVGEVANEYCPGRFSINAGGRIKLVGVAQRMTSYAYQLGAIIALERSPAALQAIAEAYETMELPFDHGTYGAVRDLRPNVTVAAAQQAIESAVVEFLMT